MGGKDGREGWEGGRGKERGVRVRRREGPRSSGKEVRRENSSRILKTGQEFRLKETQYVPCAVTSNSFGFLWQLVDLTELH